MRGRKFLKEKSIESLSCGYSFNQPQAEIGPSEIEETIDDSEGELDTFPEEEEEDTESEVETNEKVWKKKVNFSRKIKFSLIPGTTKIFNIELECFESIWNSEIMDIMVKEINRYGN